MLSYPFFDTDLQSLLLSLITADITKIDQHYQADESDQTLHILSLFYLFVDY